MAEPEELGELPGKLHVLPGELVYLGAGRDLQEGAGESLTPSATSLASAGVASPGLSLAHGRAIWPGLNLLHGGGRVPRQGQG